MAATTATERTGTGNVVVDAINRDVSDSRVRLAMLVGTHLESGWNTKAVGDQGRSFGPYQIFFVAHPGISVAQAEDPDWSTRFMLGSYQAGVQRVPESLWERDPKNAAALAAFYAERPSVMYPQGRIDAAWAAVQSIGTGTLPSGTTGAGGPPAATTDPAGGGSGSQVEGFNPVGWLVGSIAKDIGPLVMTALFVLTGLGLAAAGAWRAAR